MKGLFGSVFRARKVDGVEEILPVVAELLQFSGNKKISGICLG